MYGAEFAAYDTGLGVSIDPKLTMGENIADLGGLNLGSSAYHTSLHGAPAPLSRQVSRPDRRAEYGRLVQGLPRSAGREDVHSAGGSGDHLVGGGPLPPFMLSDSHIS